MEMPDDLFTLTNGFLRVWRRMLSNVYVRFSSELSELDTLVTRESILKLRSKSGHEKILIGA
jgi:hypothetical protein